MKRTLPRSWLACTLTLLACGDSAKTLETIGTSDDPSQPEEVLEVNVPSGRPVPIPDSVQVGGGEFPVDPNEEAGAEPEADAALDDGAVDELDAAVEQDAGSDAAPPSADAGDAGCVVRARAEDVDLLFLIDNSGSMAQEQARLIEKLAQLISALTAGDREAGKATPRTDAYPGRYFTPPRSLHIGVATSNLGAPPGVVSTASNACLPDNGGVRGNGVLLSSGATGANDLVDLATNAVVRRGVPECANVLLGPHYLAFGAAQGEVAASNTQAMQNALFQFSCVAAVGVDGCGIEQPLEAIWKALAPHTVSDFVGPDTQGQADRANTGFVRPDSVLAAVLVSDEDDCSVTSAGTLMFERSAPEGVPQVNVRCQLLAENPSYAGFVQPIARYTEGLLGLRRTVPGRFVFAGIVGLPDNTVDLSNYPALLADPRMQVALDGSSPTSSELRSVCGSDSAPDGGVASGRAYAGRRYVRLAQAVTAGGGSAVLQSICDADYAPVVDALVARIGTQLSEGCTRVDGGSP